MNLVIWNWIHLLWNSILSYLPLHTLTHISLNSVSLLPIQFQFSKADFCSVRMTDQAQTHKSAIHFCRASCTVCARTVARWGRPRVSDLWLKSIRCKETLRCQTSDKKCEVVTTLKFAGYGGGRKQIRWNEEAGLEPLSGEEVATPRRQSVRALCDESEFWLDEYRKPHFCQDHFGQRNFYWQCSMCCVGQNFYFV